jgi:hypothetical protein
MSKQLDAKSLQLKLEGLYKGKDLTSEDQDDKVIVRHDTLSIKAKERYSDPTFKEKHRESLEKIYNNPNWQKRMKELGQDPKANASRSKASQDLWKDEKKRKTILKKREKTRKTSEYKEKMAKVYADPKRKQKCIEGGRTRAKSITTPAGVFEASTDAAKHYGIGPQAMRARTKLEPHLYYYTENGPGKKPKPKAKKTLEKYIRQVNTPLGTFDNISDAAKKHNCHSDTIKYRIKNNPAEYSWLADKPSPKQVSTPDGVFENLEDASKHYSKTTKTIRAWMTQKPTEFYYIKD